ncbi:hypothetical protein E2C01_079865 [Portunus trituberculatus]|uniref:Major facilitator superfamily (MFS) profile domain-containing protein n=1 Tax=Portunus trituberculatus TaxID=210409 RepID=A0A5B7ITY3_PORTR|nr:hypothetical protein [Portunus trituberculatus]
MVVPAAPFIALTSIIIVDLLSLRQLTNAFGLLCIFRGIAGILGPPVSGTQALPCSPYLYFSDCFLPL